MFRKIRRSSGRPDETIWVSEKCFEVLRLPTTCFTPSPPPQSLGEASPAESGGEEGRLNCYGQDRLGKGESDFAFDHFLQGDVGKPSTKARIDHGAFSCVQLLDPLADDIYQNLLVGDFLEGFFEQMAGHNFRQILVR